MNTEIDALVIGGGQAALAVAYFLKRHGVNFLVLDNQSQAGGAWLHGWKSLQLFSPAEFSSLPGWRLPQGAGPYPTRDELVSYFQGYEARYAIPIRRPLQVERVTKQVGWFDILTNSGNYRSRAVISCTGTWGQPVIPTYPGQGLFEGLQIHSAHYADPSPFAGMTVLVVGGGNSGAQILAEVSETTRAVWVTKEEPTFLADEVDGRYLFQIATERYHAQLEGREASVPVSLGDVVMVEPVRRARDRGALKSVRPFKRFYANGVVWDDGSETQIDAVIWCTGFRPAIEHLRGLPIFEADGRILTTNTRCQKEPGLWLVGYGDWTGFGSATLIGGQRYARKTSTEVVEYLG